LLSNPRDERDKDDNAPNLALGRERDPNKMKIWQILSRDGNKMLPTTTKRAAGVFGRGSISLPIIYFFNLTRFGHLSTFTPF